MTAKKLPTGLLNVRDTATALGVHENTVRRWEKEGHIPAVRLPSGVRRFRREDVAHLKQAMQEEALRDAEVLGR